jgi:hypothetical protein
VPRAIYHVEDASQRPYRRHSSVRNGSPKQRDVNLPVFPHGAQSTVIAFRLLLLSQVNKCPDACIQESRQPRNGDVRLGTTQKVFGYGTLTFDWDRCVSGVSNGPNLSHSRPLATWTTPRMSKIAVPLRDGGAARLLAPT